jgi:hypothetical protein
MERRAAAGPTAERRKYGFAGMIDIIGYRSFEPTQGVSWFRQACKNPECRSLRTLHNQ